MSKPRKKNKNELSKKYLKLSEKVKTTLSLYPDIKFNDFLKNLYKMYPEEKNMSSNEQQNKERIRRAFNRARPKMKALDKKHVPALTIKLESLKAVFKNMQERIRKEVLNASEIEAIEKYISSLNTEIHSIELLLIKKSIELNSK